MTWNNRHKNQGWQVSANVGLHCSLNWFELVSQKQLSTSFCQRNILHHHVHCQNWSFVIVSFVEMLLLMNIKPE